MTSHFQMRFGMLAVQMKFITANQLMEATRVQVREDVERKPHRFLGEILIDQGRMRPS